MPHRACCVNAIALLFLAAGCHETYEVEKTEYSDPPKRFALSDDVLDASRIPDFDPELVHPDPVGDWELNLSQTVFRLDTPVLKPDRDAKMLKLRPSYKDALESNITLLPSVNVIDGKAKQFDDGLYAALDLAYYSGHEQTLLSHVELIRRIAEKAGPDHPAAPYLAAGLKLAGVDVPVTDEWTRDEYLDAFEFYRLGAKPLGFYNWTPELAQCYRFLKYFQDPFPIVDGEIDEIPRELAAVVQGDPALSEDYRKAVEFYARLTNPLVALNLLDLTDEADASALAGQQFQSYMHPAVAVFPASTSKEQRLFDRLFPGGFPHGADLMQELIGAVQSGKVDLAPEPDSGWYDYQSHALETFLLPERGEESRKLLLSSRYKQRMFDAFAALITKRRETHVRQVEAAGMAASEAYEPLDELSPRLRLEPNATYYLRTARAYAFLQLFLVESVGEELLRSIKGLREGGDRATDLATELESQKNLFYGFYLLSMEDVGLRPSLGDTEVADVDAARKLALEWLQNYKNDPDLAVDTRVVVPVAINPQNRTTHLWGTIGVRLARLNVEFERNHIPSVRPAGSEEEWKEFDGHVIDATYYIPVDEFISVEIPRLDCPTREEFRKLCDEAESKEELIELLQGKK